jgi:hypothetical protein
MDKQLDEACVTNENNLERSLSREFGGFHPVRTTLGLVTPQSRTGCYRIVVSAATGGLGGTGCRPEQVKHIAREVAS